jgi:hypothetical protein
MKNPAPRLRLTQAKILAWADAWRRRTGRYPTKQSGAVQPGGRLTWKNVDASLCRGFRGLAGGSSLARLLADCRGVRYQRQLPRLTEAQILRWADRHFGRTGRWPHRRSGPIPDAPGENWQKVQNALTFGLRGLEGGASLAWLLAKHGRKRNRRALPPLTMEQIIAWAEAQARQTDRWPTAKSGPVLAMPVETWGRLNEDLRWGRRGLPGGTSLAQLIRLYRYLKMEADHGGWLWEGNRRFFGTAAQLTARNLGGQAPTPNPLPPRGRGGNA